MMSDNIFQERAENLSKTELEEWGVFTDKDKSTIKKLLSNSAKLLIGPRGSGKSMLLKAAYYEAINSEEILPIYSNYEKYLYIEPLLHEKSNGNIIFTKWVLAKIVVDSMKTLNDLNVYDATNSNIIMKKYFNTNSENIQNLVYQLEGGNYNNISENINQFTISVGTVLEYLSELLPVVNKNRVILLLDDAAHAFSSDLQKEFFDIFRILKSSIVSSKAAIYPGITNFSPYFNIGHDGLYVEAGYSIDNKGYINFCDELLQKRLGDKIYSKLHSKPERLENIYYASNGIPRGIIVMTQYLLDEEEDKLPPESKFYDAIDTWCSIIESFHSSLKYRLPRYSNFIDVGESLLNSLIVNIKSYNSKKETNEKTVFFALSQPMPKELERVINLLEYSGLVSKLQRISKGEKGIYNRYMIHIAKVISSNAFASGKRKTLASSCESLKNLNIGVYVRNKSDNFLGKELLDKCKFNLPPCPNCGKERISDEARFCAFCGYELKTASVFYEILNQDISVLPLTLNKLVNIKRDSKIRTIKDILMDVNGVELKKVHGIQGYWADKILSYAEEFIGG